MLAASEREDYERAKELRDALRWLEQLEEPVAVEVIGTGDADVIGFARDGDDAVGGADPGAGGPGRRPGAPVPRGRRGGDATRRS